MSWIDCHTPPDPAAIEANKAKEPEGERIRAELVDFLERNKIVGILLDTERHHVGIDIAKLPPRIKSVLTIWGSIFVRDDGDVCSCSDRLAEVCRRAPDHRPSYCRLSEPKCICGGKENRGTGLPRTSIYCPACDGPRNLPDQPK